MPLLWQPPRLSRIRHDCKADLQCPPDRKEHMQICARNYRVTRSAASQQVIVIKALHLAFNCIPVGTTDAAKRCRSHNK